MARPEQAMPTPRKTDLPMESASLGSETVMSQNDSVSVLIVDDEERFRITTKATLERRGFQVSTASTGLEAIEEVKKRDIDVVVLDVKMPGMDGHATLHELKRIKPDIEVIMLTGHGSLDSAAEGWHEGVFAYLTKPSNIDFLAQRIREAYDKKRGVAQHERRVGDVMEPLSAIIRTVQADQSVAEAVEAMRKFFAATITATKQKESLFRSLLVTDEHNKIIGLISLTHLLQGLQPHCLRLSDDRPARVDSVSLDLSSYWRGFSSLVRDMASKKVRDLMPEKPPTIGAEADLIEATNKLLSLRVQSLLVLDNDKVVGLLRDSDLFSEMANIIRQRPRCKGDSKTKKSDSETATRELTHAPDEVRFEAKGENDGHVVHEFS